MKATIPALLALLPLALPAASPPMARHTWRADPSDARPASFRIPHGSAALLEARLPETPEAASFHWQTNGMGALWWEAPAEVSTGAVSVVWTPAMDAGADDVRAFFRIAQDAGPDYSAFANLRLLPSPGAVPNALPLPVRTIDFAAVLATNAPWIEAETDPVASGWLDANTNAAGRVAVAAAIEDYSGSPVDYMTIARRVVDEVDSGVASAKIYTDAAIAAATPADYAAVSNAAMSALQAEADPDFREWAATNGLHSAVETAGEQAEQALAGLDVLDRYIGLVQAEARAVGPAATNYVDAVAGALGDNFDVIFPAIGIIGPAATNYTDAAVAGVVADAERASVAGVTNFVAEAVAQLGAGDPAAELHRLILADLWRRVDALEGSDGSGYVTAAAAEALWADRLAAVSTNVFWYLRNAAAAGAELFQAQLALVQPRAPTGFSETRFNSSRGISIPLDPTTARAYAATAGGSRLSITSFSGASLNPAWIRLSGWSDVVWPDGIVRTGLDYDPARVCVFRIQQIGSAVIVEGVAQQ